MAIAAVPVLATRRGKDLTVPRGASLPAVCIKCGAVATVPWRNKFYWHHPLLYLLIIFPGLLIYAIVAAIIRKHMELNVPLCEAHNEERRRYKIIMIVMLLGFVPVGLVLGFSVREALGWITGAGMFLAGLLSWSRSSLQVSPKRIDESGGVFRGACAEFLNKLPEQL